MIDLHQGFSGHEPNPNDDRPTTVADAALAQIEAASAAAKGRWRIAALQQLEAARLLGRVAGSALRDRLSRKR